jgi:hypothetical protein
MEYLTPEEVTVKVDRNAVARCPECKGLFHKPENVNDINKLGLCGFCWMSMEDRMDERSMDHQDLNSFYIGEIK